jgi:tRNA pseudouridine13 synthase
MFGAKMRWPEGEVAELERAVLAGASPEPLRFDELRHLGEGTRRPLRLFVTELTAERAATSDAAPQMSAAPPDVHRESTGRAVVITRFVLPKGGYATTVLGRACRLLDASRGSATNASEAEASLRDEP